jgi:hypothetical protein
MRFDVRLPIGLVFVLIGLLVAARGLIGGPALAQAESAGLNIDLIWGAAMAAFGAALLAFVAWRRRKGSP